MLPVSSSGEDPRPTCNSCARTAESPRLRMDGCTRTAESLLLCCRVDVDAWTLETGDLESWTQGGMVDPPSCYLLAAVRVRSAAVALALAWSAAARLGAPLGAGAGWTDGVAGWGCELGLVRIYTSELMGLFMGLALLATTTTKPRLLCRAGIGVGEQATIRVPAIPTGTTLLDSATKNYCHKE